MSYQSGGSFLPSDAVQFKNEVAFGPGGSVTQATSRSTGVTLNARTGQITTTNSSLAAAAEATFVVTNSKVKATSVPVIAMVSGGTSLPTVSAVADGSFSITLTNPHASTADTTAMVINFVVLDAATS